jgi:hypothetical protein
VTSGASIDQRFSLYKHGNAKSEEKVEIFVTAFRIPLILLGYAGYIQIRADAGNGRQEALSGRAAGCRCRDVTDRKIADTTASMHFASGRFAVKQSEGRFA